MAFGNAGGGFGQGVGQGLQSIGQSVAAERQRAEERARYEAEQAFRAEQAAIAQREADENQATAASQYTQNRLDQQARDAESTRQYEEGVVRQGNQLAFTTLYSRWTKLRETPPPVLTDDMTPAQMEEALEAYRVNLENADRLGLRLDQLMGTLNKGYQGDDFATQQTRDPALLAELAVARKAAVAGIAGGKDRMNGLVKQLAALEPNTEDAKATEAEIDTLEAEIRGHHETLGIPYTPVFRPNVAALKRAQFQAAGDTVVRTSLTQFAGEDGVSTAIINAANERGVTLNGAMKVSELVPGFTDPNVTIDQYLAGAKKNVNLEALLDSGELGKAYLYLQGTNVSELEGPVGDKARKLIADFAAYAKNPSGDTGPRHAFIAAELAKLKIPIETVRQMQANTALTDQTVQFRAEDRPGDIAKGVSDAAAKGDPALMRTLMATYRAAARRENPNITEEELAAREQEWFGILSKKQETDRLNNELLITQTQQGKLNLNVTLTQQDQRIQDLVKAGAFHMLGSDGNPPAWFVAGFGNDLAAANRQWGILSNTSAENFRIASDEQKERAALLANQVGLSAVQLEVAQGTKDVDILLAGVKYEQGLQGLTLNGQQIDLNSQEYKIKEQALNDAIAKAPFEQKDRIISMFQRGAEVLGLPWLNSAEAQKMADEAGLNLDGLRATIEYRDNARKDEKTNTALNQLTALIRDPATALASNKKIRELAKTLGIDGNQLLLDAQYALRSGRKLTAIEAMDRVARLELARKGYSLDVMRFNEQTRQWEAGHTLATRADARAESAEGRAEAAEGRADAYLAIAQQGEERAGEQWTWQQAQAVQQQANWKSTFDREGNQRIEDVAFRNQGYSTETFFRSTSMLMEAQRAGRSLTIQERSEVNLSLRYVAEERQGIEGRVALANRVISETAATADVANALRIASDNPGTGKGIYFDAKTQQWNAHADVANKPGVAEYIAAKNELVKAATLQETLDGRMAALGLALDRLDKGTGASEMSLGSGNPNAPAAPTGRADVSGYTKLIATMPPETQGMAKSILRALNGDFSGKPETVTDPNYCMQFVRTTVEDGLGLGGRALSGSLFAGGTLGTGTGKSDPMNTAANFQKYGMLIDTKFDGTASKLRPGDLIFQDFNDNTKDHVAIYMGVVNGVPTVMQNSIYTKEQGTTTIKGNVGTMTLEAYMSKGAKNTQVGRVDQSKLKQMGVNVTTNPTGKGVPAAPRTAAAPPTAAAPAPARAGTLPATGPRPASPTNAPVPNPLPNAGALPTRVGSVTQNGATAAFAGTYGNVPATARKTTADMSELDLFARKNTDGTWVPFNNGAAVSDYLRPVFGQFLAWGQQNGTDPKTTSAETLAKAFETALRRDGQHVGPGFYAVALGMARSYLKGTK